MAGVYMHAQCQDVDCGCIIMGFVILAHSTCLLYILKEFIK